MNNITTQHNADDKNNEANEQDLTIRHALTEKEGQNTYSTLMTRETDFDHETFEWELRKRMSTFD